MKLGALVKRPRSIFYGWWVALASAIIASIGGGFYFYGFTTFLLPISAELNLSRAVTSSVFSVARLEGALEGPIAGWLIDRFGARKLIIVGVLIFSAGYIAMHWMNSLTMFFILYAAVIAIGYQTGFVHTQYALANKWFVKQRSKATGVVNAAFAIGGAVIVPVLAWLIIHYGWRIAFVIAGVITLLVSLPLCLLIRNLPEEKGLLPDGDEAKTKEATETLNSATEEVSFTVKEALRTRSFWILALAFTLRTFIIGAIWVHMVPLLVFKGFDEQGAANAISILLVCSIPARLIFGWLGDIYPKRYLLMLCCFIETGALVILLTAQNIWQVYLFVIVFALGYGVAPLHIAIVGDYFGRRNFATIRGTLTLIFAVGTITGPIYAGHIYDVTNSYQIAFITFIVAYFLTAVTFFFARRPKLPVRATSYTTSPKR